jgi:hypothetical protein
MYPVPHTHTHTHTHTHIGRLDGPSASVQWLPKIPSVWAAFSCLILLLRANCSAFPHSCECMSSSAGRLLMQPDCSALLVPMRLLWCKASAFCCGRLSNDSTSHQSFSSCGGGRSVSSSSLVATKDHLVRTYCILSPSSSAIRRHSPCQGKVPQHTVPSCLPSLPNAMRFHRLRRLELSTIRQGDPPRPKQNAA